MQIGLLGPFEVSLDGVVVEVRGVRLRGLLARLALDAGRFVPVSTLAGALWEDAELTDEVNALQSLVSRLRRALPDPGVLESGPAGYRLGVDPEAVDVHRFAMAARSGHELLGTGQTPAAAATLHRALGLWRGAALVDVATAPFVAAEQQRLEELRVAAYEDLAEAELALSHPADVLDGLEPLVDAHPFRERLRALQMRALAATGRGAEALTAYEKYRSRLVDDLGADPGAEIQQVHLALLRGELDPVAPRQAQRSARLTSFVGREREVESLSAQITEQRLVTLVGPGGSGKTRLAAETADHIASTFPGGTWFAALAPLDEPRDLTQAVVGVLGLRDVALSSSTPMAATTDPTTRLTDALGGAPALLVLDNCEHLVEAAATLAEELLIRCPHLHVVATSREPLGILGEVLVAVPPLSRPAEGSTVDAAVQVSSVRLFADRAAAVSPGFTVDESTVDAVVEICRRLDGLPLAIELAAARLRTMSVSQIAARLDDRFRLLTGGSRTALPRHRTLRAVVAWSWDLLDPPERALAERLAVLPGGVTPESATALLADGAVGAAARPPTTADVLDLMTALVDKSILQVLDADEPRYRMLETIREFGLEQLAERDELAPARRAHARWVRDLAERSDGKVTGPDQLVWIRLLAAERDNCSAALRYAVDTDDVETAARITAALASYWLLCSNHEDSLVWATAVRDMPGTAPPLPAAIVLAVHAFSLVVMDFGNPAVVADTYGTPATAEELDRAIAAAGGPRAHPILAFARPILSMAEGRDDEALVRLAEGLALTEDPWTKATLLLLRGMLMQNQGDQVAMARDLADARDRYERLGDRWGRAMTSMAAAELHAFADETAPAIEALTETVALMSELGAEEDRASSLLRLSTLLALTGRLDEAALALDELAGIVGESPQNRLQGFLGIGRATLAMEAGDLAGARLVLDDTLEIVATGHAPLQLRAMALGFKACVSARLGELDLARGLAREAYACGLGVQDMPIAAATVTAWAYVQAVAGDAEQAARALGLAGALRGVDDLGPGPARWVRELAAAELGRERVDALVDEGLEVGHDAALVALEPLIGTPVVKPSVLGTSVEDQVEDQVRRR